MNIFSLCCSIRSKYLVASTANFTTLSTFIKQVSITKPRAERDKLQSCDLCDEKDKTEMHAALHKTYHHSHGHLRHCSN